ncbi:MAG: glutamine-synthetase adenylyltransferase [Pseudomonadota bacterium]
MALDREPALAARLSAGELAATEEDAALPVMRRLRLARRQLALRVAIGDLAGALDLTAVTAALTDFADHALDTAIRAAIMERTPDAEPVGFAAIALGKQGSRELNYSSDIDPIFLFDPATLPTRAREEPQEAAVRIGKRVIDILQTRDGDGYVLRVDLRLRPSPEATPVALPIDAAIGYYESQALPWERAAFIRARACAGDLALGCAFLGAIQPFIWRRALDFGAIGEIRGISRRIRDHHQGQVFGPGFDLKRGRGGIREVEFFAQVHQLIHGGRDPALRAPATRDALAALAGAGWIGDDEAAELSDAYTLLRTIEHRVQMVDDRQTHVLPIGERLDSLARLHGVADGAALLALLASPVARVGAIYDAIEPDAAARLPGEAEPLGLALAKAGFTDTVAAMRRVAEWRGGAYPALRSAAAQAALEAVLPGLVTALGAAPGPDAALLRFDALLARLPSAINVFRLLEARPALAHLLATILSHAPTLADALGRRAGLLDGLIDASALDPVGNVTELAQAMAVADLPYEAALDHVRRVVGERRFVLGVQIVAAAADPLAVAAGYARVAEAAIATLAAATIADFARAHGRVPDSEFVVLAQRVTAALSVATAAGPLYEIDTRLRPSGAQGPLVVSVDAFERYQRESAWTWEHMALTRARPVFGSAAARASVQAIIDTVLAGARPERDVMADAVTMRAEMATHKPPAGPLDAKLLPGGLVDLEFAVHTAQLIHRAGFDPDLPRAIGALAGRGLLADLRGAHDLLTRLLVTLRLVAPDAAEPEPATQALVARAVGAADWAQTVAWLGTARQEVAAAWAAVSGGSDDE